MRTPIRLTALLAFLFLHATVLAQDRVAAPHLGIESRAPTADEARMLGLERLVGRPMGQVVTALEKDSPAEKAGLKAGDVVLALDGNALYSRDDLEDFVRASAPGRKLKATVKRGAEEKRAVEVTMGGKEAPASAQRIAWQFAGPGQYEAALAEAKRLKKPLLVGLSGAET